MMKKLLILSCLLFCSVLAYAGGGNGGPIGVRGLLDLSPLSDYIEFYGIPRFDDTVNMWGGAGTSWLSRSFGLGITVFGGFQMQHEGANYASIYSVIGTYNLENILYETNTIQFGMRFGVGYATNHLVIHLGSDRSEFAVDSLLFPVSLVGQLKITEVTRVELAVNYYLIAGDEWIRTSGTDPEEEPGETSLNCLSASIGLRFGSSYMSESGVKQRTGSSHEGIIQGGGY